MGTQHICGLETVVKAPDIFSVDTRNSAWGRGLEQLQVVSEKVSWWGGCPLVLWRTIV